MNTLFKMKCPGCGLKQTYSDVGRHKTECPMPFVTDENKYSFDGFGINGPDKYRERLATLTAEGQRVKFGPEMARALKALELLRRGLGCGVFDDAPVFKADAEKILSEVVL